LSPAGPSVSREGEAEAGHKTRPYENGTRDRGRAGHKTRPYENGTRDRGRGRVQDPALRDRDEGRGRGRAQDPAPRGWGIPPPLSRVWERGRG